MDTGPVLVSSVPTVEVANVAGDDIVAGVEITTR
jgi:hypothetical protein